jgi:hypothetical protein
MKKVVLLATVLAASLAYAEEDDDAFSITTAGESPRSGAVELRFGSYSPAIANTPEFQALLGSGSLLLFELEIDKQFFQKVGSFGVGFIIGYGERYGTAVLQADGVTPSAERTALRVLPIKGVAVYRMDYPALHWHVPLVPYAKAGLVFQPWWMLKGSRVENTDFGRGSGAKYGYTVVGGLAFQLDFLDERLAKDFDSDVGVNHSYLFGEYNHVGLNSFSGTGFDFSSQHWMFGLAMEY